MGERVSEMYWGRGMRGWRMNKIVIKDIYRGCWRGHGKGEDKIWKVWDSMVQDDGKKCEFQTVGGFECTLVVCR